MSTRIKFDGEIELPDWAMAGAEWNQADIESGFYSARYFNVAREVLADRGAKVTMQVFQKGENVVCGTLMAAGILRAALPREELDIYILPDGEVAYPWEPVMFIVGDLAKFAHFESVILGILADESSVATKMSACVFNANGKPVIYLADRFNNYGSQEGQGYAALIGGAAGVCTEAMALRSKVRPIGTMPHALIAAFGGDTVAATLAYAEKFPEDEVTSLVDFDNDCVETSLKVARVLGSRLSAVRLDTSEKLIDCSILNMFPEEFKEKNAGWRSPNGVCPALVHNVREALDKAGHTHVKIVVSGGFSPDKIKAFEANDVPVDVYGVGSSCLKGGFDFTADVVEPAHKVGRCFQQNPRVKRVA